MKRFSSKIPQEESLAVEFVTQELYPNEIYWACPPPRLIIELFKHIVHFVILLFENAPMEMPYIVRGGFIHRLIEKFKFAAQRLTKQQGFQHFLRTKKIPMRSITG